MCGIVGIWSRTGENNEQVVEAMSNTLAHRGPDGNDISFVAPVTMGHRRLAIIDLVSGDQPMSTTDERYTIVFNGEIYNYIELRQELEQEGLVFKTTSDTEVLLQTFVHWGEKCLEKLVGMFALAIWDRSEETLFLARDRSGKKPLLYFWDGHSFAFASELKALLQVPGCETRLNAQALELYLALGYVPAPLAIFQKVQKLQPGHYLKFKKKQVQIRRYWFPESTPCRPATTHTERLAEFRTLFAESIRLRLRSDVPIGIFLSGGIDSSAVAAEVVAQGKKLQALSVVFDEDQTDLPYAIQVAEQLGLPHEIIEVGGSFKNDLEHILWHYDEPFADTSNIPSFYLARAARKYCKVVLNGDGADEVFAGYRHYEYIYWKQSLKRLACAAGLKDGRIGDPWLIYFQSKAIFRYNERINLLNSDTNKNSFEQFIRGHPFLGSTQPKMALYRALRADRHVYLPNDLLYKMDIALSAFGVEGRSPFLDHRLLEWAQFLPIGDLVCGKAKKLLLRKAYNGILPSEIIDRPKQGFGSPITRWLEGSLSELLDEYLPSTLLEQQSQRHVLKSFRERPSQVNSTRVWVLLMFALWAHQWRVTW